MEPDDSSDSVDVKPVIRPTDQITGSYHTTSRTNHMLQQSTTAGNMQGPDKGIYKVWSADRKRKKFVLASSLAEFIQIGAKKLGLAKPGKVVLESDGTEVETEEELILMNKEVLILLDVSEEWMPAENYQSPGPLSVTSQRLGSDNLSFRNSTPDWKAYHNYKNQLARRYGCENTNASWTCHQTEEASTSGFVSSQSQSVTIHHDSVNELASSPRPSFAQSESGGHHLHHGLPPTPSASECSPSQDDWRPFQGVHIYGASLPRSPSSPGMVAAAIAVDDVKPREVAESSRAPYRDCALPKFSSTVEIGLKCGKTKKVWNRMIQEAAEFYYTQNSAINSSKEYETIGRDMYEAYPAIEHEGKYPWSLFTASLSQRMRHRRWNEKRKSHYQFEEVSPPAKQKVVEQVAEQPPAYPPHIWQPGYSEDREELKKAWIDFVEGRDDGDRVVHLQKQTRHERLRWLRTIPPGHIVPILDEFPCFNRAKFILLEMELKVQSEPFLAMEHNLQKLLAAINNMRESKCQGDLALLEAIRFIEQNTNYNKGRGIKSKSILDVRKVEDISNLDTEVFSMDKEPPKLIILISYDNCFKKALVTMDTVTIDTECNSVDGAIIVLLASYYAFNINYPRMYSQVLGVLQQYVVGEAFMGEKCKRYKQFVKELASEWDKLHHSDSIQHWMEMSAVLSSF